MTVTTKSDGRVALVTGATGGLGPAVVEAFERAGWQIVRERRGDLRSSLRWFDAADPAAVGRAVSAAVSSYGRIDALLNLVGTWKPQPSIAEVPDALWDEMFSVNLKTAFVVSRAVVPQMLKQRSGRIINVGAKAGERGTARNAAYAASKAGVLALTESMAEELKGSGVTVNAIVPSVIDTPANRKSMPDADFSRWVPPEHIAATMLFLCSDQAASITGERVRVFNRA
ncbi:MAG: SDR family oxidoreductase [Chloroflexi bacterium]|nr:SDR family oxidoreductase [Chloroflexota bacterium]